MGVFQHCFFAQAPLFISSYEQLRQTAIQWQKAGESKQMERDDNASLHACLFRQAQRIAQLAPDFPEEGFVHDL